MRPTSRSTRQRLLDILDSIEKGRSLARDLTLEQFSKSWLHRSAIERLIEIISEASRHLPPASKVKAPTIPWQDVADIGNVLRHTYEKVDPEIIWAAVQKDFGPLEEAVRAMLADLPDHE